MSGNEQSRLALILSSQIEEMGGEDVDDLMILDCLASVGLKLVKCNGGENPASAAFFQEVADHAERRAP